MRAWQRLLAIAGLCLLLLSGTLAHARAAKTPAPWLTFVRYNSDRRHTLMMVAPDCTIRREISVPYWLVWQEIIWSPNGKALAVAGDNNAGTPVAVLIHPFGPLPSRQLGVNAFPAPRWSPDSRRLFGYFYVGRRHGLLVLDLNGRVVGEIADPSPIGLTYDWSPAGDRLAYTVDNRHIISVAPDGQAAHVTRADAIPPTHRFQDLRWSPDGQWIAYAARVPGAVEGAVCVVSRHNDPPRCHLFSPPVQLLRLAWTPESRALLLTTCEKSCRESLTITRWDFQTAGQELLLHGAYKNATPLFSPGARYLAYSEERRTEDKIDVFVQDTTRATTCRVQANMYIGAPLAWRPAIDLAWHPASLVALSLAALAGLIIRRALRNAARRFGESRQLNS